MLILFKLLMTNILLALLGVGLFHLIYEDTKQAPPWAVMVVGGSIATAILLVVALFLTGIWSL